MSISDFPETMPDNWPLVLRNRADARYVGDSEGTRNLLYVTADYIEVAAKVRAIREGDGEVKPVASRRWDKTYPGGQWLYFPPDHDGEKLVTLAQLAEVAAERDEALRAEDAAKDCFWAIYHDWVELKGHGLSTEAARTMLAERAITAEARVKALLDLIESNGSGSMIRAARATLSQEAPK